MNKHLLFLINGWAGHNRLLDGVMIFCSQYLIYVVFAVGALWLLYALRKRHFGQVACFAANLGITFVLLQIAAHLYLEHRPFVVYQVTQLVSHGDDQSFPSDHTTAASAIALGFLVFTPFKKSGMLLLIAAFLIGFARIFTGLHYPVDIGGAIVAALVGAGITFGIYRLLRCKEKFDGWRSQ